MAIVLWIGIIITAQAFQTTPPAHAPAVAIGLFPAIAGWGLLVLTQTFGADGNASHDLGLAGRVLADHAAFQQSGLQLDGLVALSQGFMVACMVWSAMSANLIDRNFRRAAAWALIGAVAAFFGFVHAGSITPAGSLYDIGWATGWRWAIGYILCAFFFLVVERVQRSTNDTSDPPGGRRSVGARGGAGGRNEQPKREVLPPPSPCADGASPSKAG